jgi:hypothetical protein
MVRILQTKLMDLFKLYRTFQKERTEGFSYFSDFKEGIVKYLLAKQCYYIAKNDSIAGLLLFKRKNRQIFYIPIAKNNISHSFLAEQIKEHTVTRRYIALVHGNIKEDSGTINAYIGRHPIERKKMAVVKAEKGRHAVTHFTVLQRFGQYTLIECRLETGRTHQIRVHMSHIKHPIVGDPVYGPKNAVFKLEGQMLHAKVLGFIHPTKKVYIEFEAPIPKYFQQIIEKLNYGCKK